MRIKTILLRSFAALFTLCLLGVLGIWLWLRQSLPEPDGEFAIPNLTQPVEINFSTFGVPAINAGNRLDAIRALGFVSARDRLFQMDLMRRKNAGRLAEIFGALAVGSDTRIRIFDFNSVAHEVFQKLPETHQNYLKAYAEGVNGYLDQAKHLPYEFSLLNYRPDAWQPEDTLLIELGMFDMLTAGAGQEERMLSVMEKALPADIFAFFTPDTDNYTESLYGNDASWRPAQPVPVESLAKTLSLRPEEKTAMAGIFKDREFVSGSNAWAVSGSKTQDGRAILANDMHLGISVPNIWYQTQLNYPDVHAAGAVLPGTPLIVAGSNSHLSWGVTNLTGDFLDLVTLEINPSNPDEYKAGDRWLRFGHRQETIQIKQSPPQTLEVKTTIWGPVSQDELLGKPVAIHWTALDSDAVNIGLMDFEQTQSLAKAIEIAHQTGSPQLNILFADEQGNIAWTLMGKTPKRMGLDGSVSRLWGNTQTNGWQGYVEAKNLPTQINPPNGILVSANDRHVGKSFPHVIGHQFVPGYRAYRITQQLNNMQTANELSLFALQLDTRAGFYDFYHQLALGLLSSEAINAKPELQDIRNDLLAWNGRADTDSRGFALLLAFKEQLTNALVTPFLKNCRDLDNTFEYSWLYADTPVKALLTLKQPELLPEPEHYHNWDEFILAQLLKSAEVLKMSHQVDHLTQLRWGNINRTRFNDPVFGNLPIIRWLVDMPQENMAGCGGCIRAAGPNFGASERLVISPGHLGEGILHMPAGQSAHPLSEHYNDQQDYWLAGIPLDLTIKTIKHKIKLIPQN